LEREGYLSLPVSADKPVEVFKQDPRTGKSFRQTKVLGHLSFKHAAVSCGLGQIGRSNLLLTPEFGPHQRLCAVITEAKLEPDPKVEHELCIEGCTKCEKACPVGALSGGEYDVDPCFVYWSYGFKKLPPGKLSGWPSYLKMLRQHLKRRDILVESGQTFITDVDCCIECMRACPVGSRWKDIRPQKLVPQKTPGTG
jgi:epoxyqueuosine reductase QueG